MHGIAKLGPGSALDGALTEPGLGKFANASSGGDLDLVAIVGELVLDHLLDAVVVGSDYLTRRQEEIEILPIVFFELAPPEFGLGGTPTWFVVYCHGCLGEKVKNRNRERLSRASDFPNLPDI